MIDKRRFLNTVFVIALPVIVAVFGLSVVTALWLLLLLLLWRWAVVLSAIWFPPKGPAIVLDTISASHFVEKVRWCLDRLGLDYAEQHNVGVLGVVTTGRTVPRLRFRTGLVQSSIGNSSEILRYLWGAYATELGEQAEFLEPTADRIELEKRLDRYGANLQVWIYYHLLTDRELALRAWGIDNDLVPWWQRRLLPVIYPLLSLFIRRSFKINDSHYARAEHHIEDLLADIDTRLADGRLSILGGDHLNYSDLAFAAFTGLWLQPNGYGGSGGSACRIARNRAPSPMRADIERWIEDYPKAAAFVARLYDEERGTMAAENGQSIEQETQPQAGAGQ